MHGQQNIKKKRKHFFHGKGIIITYPECVFVALFNLRVMCILLVTSPSVACTSLPYFSTFSHKRHDFRKTKIIEH